MAVLNLFFLTYLSLTSVQVVFGNNEFMCTFSSFNATLVIQHGYNATEVEQCILKYQKAECLIYTHSNLTDIPSHVIHLSRLTSLDVSNNRLPRINMTHILPVCNKLMLAVFDFNFISTIKEDDLKCFNQLTSLYVANNSMTKIDPLAFGDHLQALSYIHVIHNKLTSLDVSMLMIPVLKRHGKVTVNATWNQFTRLTNERHFTIEDIQPDYSFNADVYHNNLTTVNITYYFELLNVSNPLQLYRLASGSIGVRFNPFICDCALYPFHVLLRKFQPMDPDNPVFSPTCYNPPPLRGMLIYKVPDNQFNCSITKRCPVGCDCTFTISSQTLFVSCGDTYIGEDLPSDIPESDHIVLDVKSPNLKRLSFKRYMANVTIIDLSQCSINAIDFFFLQHLNHFQAIMLNNNRLSGLPKDISKVRLNSTRVFLSGNQFSCNCHDVWLKHWLLRNKNEITDVVSILCTGGPENGKVYIDIPDDQFVCIVTFTVLQISLIAGGAVLIMLVVILFLLKHKSIIHVYCIAFCNMPCLRSRVYSEKEYDIFIPHSCADDTIVYDIVERLENHKPPYKVLIGDRDFHVGKYIITNIMQAIQSSETTLLVLSNNFLKSQWSKTEFQRAYNNYLQSANDIRIIAVIIVDRNDLDPNLIFEELEIYLRTHTFIQYSDNMFWARLLKELPIRSRHNSFHDSSKSESKGLLSAQQAPPSSYNSISTAIQN